MTIWLIGGTSESVAIAKALMALSLPCVATVTTENARTLYREMPQLRLKVGQLDDTAIAHFGRTQSIRVIVDASHPYATAISQAAINWATTYHIPYLRFERPAIKDTADLELDSFATLIEGDYLIGQRVLLTVGYKALPLFKSLQERATLFTRILPVVNSLEVAINTGFTPERIIALRPPISKALEKAIWQNWKISLVVTKASGDRGGEAIKRLVATELGIPLIVIARPKITYLQQTSDISDVIQFCCQQLGNFYV